MKIGKLYKLKQNCWLTLHGRPVSADAIMAQRIRNSYFLYLGNRKWYYDGETRHFAILGPNVLIFFKAEKAHKLKCHQEKCNNWFIISIKELSKYFEEIE